MRLGVFLTAFALLWMAAPAGPWPDGVRAQAATARSLVASGSLDLGADLAAERTQLREGRRYAIDPPGLALSLVPIELAARAFGRAPAGVWAVPLLESATAALAAALVCVVFLAGLRASGARPAVALGMTAVLACSTGLAAAARMPDGSALAALLLTCAVLAGRRQGLRAALAAGAASGALVLVEPSLFPAALVLVVAGALRRRDPAGLFAMVLPLGVGASLVLIHRAHIGYFPDPTGDLGEGLLGLTISTGKSVLLYSPPLVLAIWALPWWWRTRRAEAAVTIAVCAAVLLASAQLRSWHGDPAWGPRRLTPILPLLLEPIALWLDVRVDGARRRARRALIALAIAGGLVQGLGAAFSPGAYPHMLAVVRNATGAPGWFSDLSDAHFIPQFSPLQGQAWLLSHKLRRPADAAADAPWKLLQQNTPHVDKELAALRFDWWALSAPRLPAALLLALAFALAAAGAFLTARRLRMLRSDG
jgi:hypothetical protein